MPPHPQHKLTSLPALLPAVCRLGSLPAFISSMTIPLSKCQVTLCAKEEHYTAASCHAGRDITHTQVLISRLFTAGHRSAHSPVCMCEESKKKKHCEFFFFFLQASKTSANRPPVSCTCQSSISLCKVKNSKKTTKKQNGINDNFETPHTYKLDLEQSLRLQMLWFREFCTRQK